MQLDIIEIAMLKAPVARNLPTLLLALMLVACVSSSSAQGITLEPVVSGLQQPVALVHAGDGTGRLFVVQQGGLIQVTEDGQVLPEPFLDVNALTAPGGERGLLDLAFHPNYGDNGRFFINYTDTDGDTVVAEYEVSADPNLADPQSGTTLLTLEQPYGNHNGGALVFGGDGYLYIGTGDGGSRGDPDNNAQDLSTLLGKMLRIDVDTGQPYGIPVDNPFVNVTGARPEIWAYGLRNPWRYSFDRQTGDLFIGDVGQNAFEEIHLQPASSAGGENYGWRLMEGTSCYDPYNDCNDGTLVLPILEYGHELGVSITGGYRYRGRDMPGWVGTYFYADFASGRLWGATQSAEGRWSSTELLDTNYSIASFGEDEMGELYIVDYSGAIYRLTSGE